MIKRQRPLTSKTLCTTQDFVKLVSRENVPSVTYSQCNGHFSNVPLNTAIAARCKIIKVYFSQRLSKGSFSVGTQAQAFMHALKPRLHERFFACYGEFLFKLSRRQRAGKIECVATLAQVMRQLKKS